MSAPAVYRPLMDTGVILYAAELLAPTPRQMPAGSSRPRRPGWAIDRCVDVFARPDGTFGFEEFRRDPEDMGW